MQLTGVADTIDGAQEEVAYSDTHLHFPRASNFPLNLGVEPCDEVAHMGDAYVPSCVRTDSWCTCTHLDALDGAVELT
jgi:hypothetical protein